MNGPDLDTLDFALDALPGASLHEALRGYRERNPVAATRIFGQPAFVVTGHEALLEAFLDEENLPPHRMYAGGIEPAVGRTFISTPSGPEHRALRKLATPAFRSRAVAAYEQEGLAELAHELLDRVEGKAEFDLIEDYAARFPYLVISRLLGLPREREDEFHDWALALLRMRDDPVAARKAGQELTRFLAPAVEERRREPRNDVISELVHSRDLGRALTDEEIFSHVRLLFPTGGETTHGSLGNLLYALFTQGDEWERVVSDREVIPATVDEGLRWETSIAVLPRMSGDAPHERFGQEIPPDTWVLFGIAGANRDPAVYEDPDRFDPKRGRHDELTFGRGTKSCPGMHLARRNLAVATEALTQRFPGSRSSIRKRPCLRRTVLRSPDRMRVRVG